jgi:ABC-type antimicrobial peptide transport system permease subunit
MKFFISIILTGLVAFAAGLQLPWFFIALAAFIVAIAIPQKTGKAFLSGFLALFLMWIIVAFVAQKNGGELIAKQVANVIPLKGNVLLITIVTGLIGGLVGGFAALTGSLGRKLFSNK